MKHLTSQEFVEVIEGRLGASRRAHVDDCDACRQEIADLRAITAAVSAGAVLPEPSPLFWDHLSARVHEAVDAEAVPARAWTQSHWGRLAGVGAALASVALVVALRVAWVDRDARVQTGVHADLASVAPDDVDAASIGQGWEFVMQLASAVSVEDMDQWSSATPHATSDMVEALSPAERAEFVKLVRARMGGVE